MAQARRLRQANGGLKVRISTIAVCAVFIFTNRLMLCAESSTAISVELRAVLENRCLKCHDPRNKKGGLDMSTRETLLAGGKTGVSVVPGKSSESLLFKMLNHDEEPFMPQKEDKLPAAQIALIGAWIDAGAPYDRPLLRPAGLRDENDRKSFWSFQPLKHPDLPNVNNRSWPKTPIDHFILAALEKENLAPAATASRRTLIRRVYFDLIGLPPTPAQVAAFVNNAEPDAYERLVDSLLADPRYGERWGRHWLDAARYADSNGYEGDEDRPNAYTYRDFVIKAFNGDMPYDTFVRWQIAGDEFEPGNQFAATATGFCTAGIFLETKNGTALEREKWRYDELDDMLATTGSAFLGLTFGCARCHDHKYDPITTRDYYQMLAAFTTTKRLEMPLGTPEELAAYKKKEDDYKTRLTQAQTRQKEWFESVKKTLQPELLKQKVGTLKITDDEKATLLAAPDKENKVQQALLKKHAGALGLKDDDYKKQFNAEQKTAWDSFDKEIKSVEKTKPADSPHALVIADTQSTPEKSWLLARGDPAHKTEEITLGFPAVLTGAALPKTAPPPGSASTYQRRAMAEWLTDVNAGAGRLLARVIVNRLWLHHFGEGIVRTPDDFGFQGERPTHPELLDWLAGELIAKGWKLKPLHKMMLMSAAYMQDAEYVAEKAKIDPDNRLLWHRRPQRLEAEALRDSILTLGGKLNQQMFGPSIKPYIPAEAMAGRNKDDIVRRPTEDGPALWRRSVYLWLKRSITMPLLDTFDAPNGSGTCGRRPRSTVATQALILLNDPFVRGQAYLFAKHVEEEAGNDPAKQIALAFELALSREPNSDELSGAMKMFQHTAGTASSKPLVNFCHVLLTLNEFSYVD